MRWRYDPHENTIHLQNELDSLLSGTDEFTVIPLNEFLNRVVEPDREALESFLRLMLGKSTTSPKELVFRFNTASNEEKWYKIESWPIFDKTQSMVGLTGNMSVVQVEGDDANISNLANWFEQAKSLTGVGTWEADVDANKLIWSLETCKMFGVSPDKGIETISNFLNLVFPEDIANLTQELEEAFVLNGYVESEYRARRADDNEVRWFLDRGKVTEAHNKKAKKRVGIVMDITERKRWEQLSELENEVFNELLNEDNVDLDLLKKIAKRTEQIFFDAIASIHLIQESTGSIATVYAPSLSQEQIGILETWDAEDIFKASAPIANAENTSAPKRNIFFSNYVNDELSSQDGPSIGPQYQCFPIRGSKQNLVAYLCLLTKNNSGINSYQSELISRLIRTIALVIDKESSFQALKASESRFSNIFNDSAIGIVISDPDGSVLEFNNAFLRMIGYQKKELEKKTIQSLTHPEDWPETKKITEELVQGVRNNFIITKRYISKSRKVIDARVSVTVQKDSANTPKYFISLCEDITERTNAEKHQQDIQKLVTNLFSNLPGIVYRCLADADRTMIFMNEYVEQVTGYPARTLINKKPFIELIHVDDRERVIFEIQKAVQSQKSYLLEYRIYHIDGSVRWIWEQGSVLESNDVGHHTEMLDGYIADITAQKSTEQKFWENQNRIDLLLKASSEAIWDWDITQNTIWRSKGFESLFGHRIQEIDKTPKSWKRYIHPDDYESLISSIEEFLLSNDHKWSASYRYMKKDGAYAHVFDKAYLIRNADNQAVRMVGGMSDVTEKVHLEERLRRSQRLESIGQLTGGVAHDFNNLLTVILGNAEMIIDLMRDDDEVFEMAEMIVSSARRGADLTQSLLTFARKQSLRPQKVSIANLVDDIYPLLAKTTGELKLVTDVSRNIWPARIDSGQLENALLNLVINSRDACESKGTITISAENIKLTNNFADNREVEEGDYVCIKVKDTGKGISEENLKWVFEPFFTTKPKGKGTGLGLAMVYGFVKQSGGHIEVLSEMNKGTTVEIYLPKFNGSTLQQGHEESRMRGMGGHEKILLVEDDELVRRFTARELGRNGYTIISAATAEEALEILDEDTPDLLFTDVLLPGGMNGIELAEQVRKTLPKLKVILTTGFTENSLWDDYNNDNVSMKLAKPYSTHNMLLAIRKSIDTHGKKNSDS